MGKDGRARPLMIGCLTEPVAVGVENRQAGAVVTAPRLGRR